MSYQEWIEQRMLSESPQGKCAEWTLEMVGAFPELKRVRGHVVLFGRERPHWWCVTPDGEVVDPTAAQFGRPVFAYLPHEEGTPEPTGKCLNCGGYVYAPRSSSCSEACDRELDMYFNHQFIVRGA